MEVMQHPHARNQPDEEGFITQTSRKGVKANGDDIATSAEEAKTDRNHQGKQTRKQTSKPAPPAAQSGIEGRSTSSKGGDRAHANKANNRFDRFQRHEAMGQYGLLAEPTTKIRTLWR
ncbi:hypothetical protein PR001_g33106 [Phytophthora rubi]|uniref:Uncharacterized protein n=1 Tax=Phytophthora rubi TaxID=129364 RepID=A0A6A3GGE5_9STRA|nr:hypothetical protein PR001_g33106 [Phytophthora rubi]